MSVLVGLVIGFALALSLLQLGQVIVGPLAEFALATILVVIALLASISLVAYLARHAIFSQLRLKAEAKLTDIREPITTLIDASRTRDATKATTSAMDLATILISWQSQLRLRQAIVGGLTALLALFAAILGSSLLVKQNELLTRQNDLVIVQNQLVEAQRRASLIFELSNVLDKIDEERDAFAITAPIRKASAAQTRGGMPDPGVAVNDTRVYVTRGSKESANQRLNLSERPRRRDYRGNTPLFLLSDRLMGRIAALSRSLRPYRSLDDQQRLSPTALSPERGQLLLSLLSSDVDMFELNHFNPVFDRADLTGLDLADMAVEHLQARDAHFAGASLSNVKFTYGRLEGANFEGADLRRVSFGVLEGACLRGATLYGSEMPELRYADLTDANIAKARFRDLSHATLSGVKGWDEVDWNGIRLFDVRDASPELLAHAGSHGAVTEADPVREELTPLSRRGCAVDGPSAAGPR